MLKPISETVQLSEPSRTVTPVYGVRAAVPLFAGYRCAPISPSRRILGAIMAKNMRCKGCDQRKAKSQFGYFYMRPNPEKQVKGRCPYCVECQKRIVTERENDPAKRERFVSRAYRARAYALKSMGFESYQDYLQSSLWKQIRRRALDRDGGKCCVCGGTANQVHHQTYSIDVLTGKNIRPLKSLCDACHRGVEFKDDGRKRDIREVGQVLYETAGKPAKSNSGNGAIPRWSESKRRQAIESSMSPDQWCKVNARKLREAGIDPASLTADM